MRACKKSRQVTAQNFEIETIFSAGFISVSRDFTPYFHFRCVARTTFDRNLIHSADACFLVMTCVGYSRAQLKTLSSLLKSSSSAFRPALSNLWLLLVVICKVYVQLVLFETGKTEGVIFQWRSIKLFFLFQQKRSKQTE